jgi:hypothetical protein
MHSALNDTELYFVLTVGNTWKKIFVEILRHFRPGMTKYGQLAKISVTTRKKYSTCIQ